MNASSWRKTDVFFIRHGESTNNCLNEMVRARFGDDITSQRLEEEVERLRSPDSLLSPRGLRQAMLLQEHLLVHKLNPDCKPGIVPASQRYRILSSPMKRCLHTAKHVAAGLGGLPVTVHPGMFESDGCYLPQPDGSTKGLPGMTAAEVEAEFTGFKCLPGMEDGWYHHPQKESAQQFLERAQDLTHYLWAAHGDSCCGSEPLVLIAHGNVLRELISRLLGVAAVVTHCNTGISHLQLWSNEGRRVASLQYANRVDHLTAEPATIAGNEVLDDGWMSEYFQHYPA